MTNKEAIKVLELFKECNAKLEPQIVLDAVDMSINALKYIDQIKAERDVAVEKE